MTDPALWLSLAAVVAAWAAAWFAYKSARAADMALRLAELQDRRRTPRLVTYVADAYILRHESTRTIMISLSISNPTDSENAISRLELRTQYMRPGGTVMQMLRPHNPGSDAIRGSGAMPFAVPARLGAHDAIAGWGVFDVADAIIGEGRIDSHVVVISDAHGETTEVAAGLLREITRETA